MRGKRWIVAALLLVLVFGGLWRLQKSRTVQVMGELVPSVETDQKVIALTFDDGPTQKGTAFALETLADLGVRATFFVTGASVEKNMGEAKQLVAAGHELGNHSYSHPRMLLKPLNFIRNEIERTDQLIREAGYEGPIHFRAPYTKKLLVLPYYLHSTGRKNISFDVEPETYPDVAGDPQKTAEHVIESVRPGSIILLHIMFESREASRQAVRPIVEELKSQGYRFVTISELLTLENQ